MTLLPSGLVVPPVEYVVVLCVLTVAAVGVLDRLDPQVDQQVVAGAVPWMVFGACAHVLYQVERPEVAARGVDIYPDVLEPLASAPAVYVTTLVAFALAWVGLLALERRSDGFDSAGVGLAVVGTVASVLLLSFAGAQGAYEGAKPYWSLIGLLVTFPLTGVTYALAAGWRPDATSRAGALGLLTVFAHALDGVTTTVGIDVLNRAERSPIPERIMEFAGTLPTEPLLGTGWLFVLVKLALAVGIVLTFADYVEERPTRGNLLFGGAVVFGLGPAVNNLLLFTLRDVGVV